MRLPDSRRLVLAAAGTALAALTALPASAGCADSAFGCGLDNDETTAAPVSARSVAALLTPRTDEVARQAYADLLPQGVQAPAEPLVAVQLTSFDSGACVRPAQASLPACPVVPGWTEGLVALRAVVEGEEGWFAVSRPTTSREEYAAGRAAGLPTYLATGSVAPEGTGLAGAVSVAGTPSLALSWRPQSGSIVDSRTFDLLAGRSGTFGVTPLLTGPDRHRTSRAVRPTLPVFDLLGGAPNSALSVPGATGTSAPRRGSVTVRIDPDLARLDDASPDALPALPLADGVTLADLVATEQVVPGASWQVDGLLLTQTDALDDGKDGPFPAPPALASAVVAGPGAQTNGFATRVSTMTRGSSLTLVNLDTTQHDVTSAASGPDGEPLFHSATIAADTAPVVGAEKLLPGQYRWVCSLHAGMTGELVVH